MSTRKKKGRGKKARLQKKKVSQVAKLKLREERIAKVQALQPKKIQIAPSRKTKKEQIKADSTITTTTPKNLETAKPKKTEVSSRSVSEDYIKRADYILSTYYTDEDFDETKLWKLKTKVEEDPELTDKVKKAINAYIDRRFDEVTIDWYAKALEKGFEDSREEQEQTKVLHQKNTQLYLAIPAMIRKEELAEIKSQVTDFQVSLDLIGYELFAGFMEYLPISTQRTLLAVMKDMDQEKLADTLQDASELFARFSLENWQRYNIDYIQKDGSGYSVKEATKEFLDFLFEGKVPTDVEAKVEASLQNDIRVISYYSYNQKRFIDRREK